MAKTAGEIVTQDAPVVFRCEWRIPRIKSVLQKEGNVFESPPYAFCDREWTLRFTKDGHFAKVHLTRVITALSHEIRVECGLAKSDIFPPHFFRKFINQVNKGKRHQLLLEINEFSLYYEENFDMIIEFSFQCSDCKSAIIPMGCGNLGSDFLNLLISGEDSDLTINVKQSSFRVHKAIIRARSPVFFSMLKHDMAEKRNGSVDIPDCEPEVFQKFLEYIYSGAVKDLSRDIMCTLYYIADKYQILQLKEECVSFMSINLSLETFCDIATVSVRHNELELLERAHVFFAGNSKVIIQTDGWVTFLEEYPAPANDFLKYLLVPEVYRAEKRKRESTKGQDEIPKKKLK